MKNVRVVSDGTPLGTHIYDTNGNDIASSLMITHIEWRHRPGEYPKLHLEILTPEIDAACEMPNV